MKTRAMSFLRSTIAVSLLATLLVSCSKENKSGGGSSGSSITTISGNGSKLPSNWKSVLANEYPCTTTNINGQVTNRRITVPVQVPGYINANAGAIYTGVTLEGDLLTIHNNGSNVSVELRVCERPELNTSSAQFIAQPILNQSYNCAIGEISAADIVVNSTYGQYQLVFFPIGKSAPSSLCQQTQYSQPYYH
ncbi:MAG: hypothetical protein QF441_12355 [Bacteriovoracaceae bacterium]|jgi:hypothetical protein|nr:hypothetical protein [Halobacteriovoraceae bacterium]MDP7321397.1 hypothetical protein [Bacteriovoracaceae bacterium]|tara:strand:+ start:1796 stop:2374 length:579 start_codon:yes stop_codon:yes gene_type:complete